MRIRQLILPAALAIGTSMSATAGNADICYSPAYSITVPGLLPTNTTVFTCPQAGQKTLPQLAAEGWLVVQLTPMVLTVNQGVDQLIIQRP